MSISICGADCKNCGCGKDNNCKGCLESNGCPFGKQCFIFEHIKAGSTESYQLFKKQLIKEFNSLGIPGMPAINELYAMKGSYVNLAYTVPNDDEIKFLMITAFIYVIKSNVNLAMEPLSNALAW